MEIYQWWEKAMNVLEVESEDGSDAKYYARSRVVVGALHTPTKTLKLHGDSVNTGL